MIREPKNQSKQDTEQFQFMNSVFEQAEGRSDAKIDGFAKFASRQAIAKFLAKYEIYKKILHINGSIVECGVLHGVGLLSFAKFSSILEPSNHIRKIIGFDTFQGFPNIDEKDNQTGNSSHFKLGGLKGSSLQYVERAVKLYDLNRPISHIPKIELVEGNLCETAPKYLENNPHLVVSLLYLDVDLYEPTRIALEVFVPRMPKGAVIVFDELNAKMFPGETIAVDEVLGLRNLKIERFPFESYVSYCVL